MNWVESERRLHPCCSDVAAVRYYVFCSDCTAAEVAVDNIEALEILTYDGDRFTVRHVGDNAELDRAIRRGGTTGQVYGKLQRLRDRYADEIRKRYPNIP